MSAAGSADVLVALILWIPPSPLYRTEVEVACALVSVGGPSVYAVVRCCFHV